MVYSMMMERLLIYFKESVSLFFSYSCSYYMFLHFVDSLLSYSFSLGLWPTLEY